MRHFVPVMILAIVLAVTGGASALTEDVPVTPAFIKDHPKEVSIRAEKRDDGLIHFTITLHLSEPGHLIAELKVREQGSAVLEASFPAIVREKAAKYYLAVSPKHLSNANFEVSESSILTVNGMPVEHPGVGCTNYQIHLADFAPKASKTSRD